MAERAAKFSLPAEGLEALEALVQALILLDAAEAKERAADEERSWKPAFLSKKDTLEGEAGERIRAYHRRKRKNGTLLEGSIRKRNSARHLRAKADELATAAESRLEATPVLHLVLIAIELLSVQPYADGPESQRSLPVSDSARLGVLNIPNELVTSQLPGQSLLSAAVEGLSDAQKVFSKFWSRVLWGIGGAAAALAVGIFAGPVIGGWVGAALFGLSGAAAVSAGLAFLGGGALAAGGFGMLGGTVVIAAAFGVAGAGGVQLFLGEHGEEGARLALVRHMGAFATLDYLRCLDHALAEDYIGAVTLQRTEYEQTASLGDKDADQAHSVAQIMGQAESWLRERYAEAVGAARVSSTPIAWSYEQDEQDENGLDDPFDGDFNGLATAMRDRERALKSCLKLLRHAENSVADVREEPWFKAVWSQLGRRTKRRLNGAGALVAAAVEEVVEIIDAQQQELDHLVAAVSKVEVLQADIIKKNELIERYQKLSTRMHREIVRLREANAAKEAEFRKIESALARAMLLAGLYRATSRMGHKAIGAGPKAKKQSDRATRNAAWLDLCLAVGLGSPTEDAAERAAAMGRELPSQDELKQVLASLEHPLGTPLDDVKKIARLRLAETHPDRQYGISKPLQAVMRQQYERVQLALELHERYAEVAA